MDGLYRGQSDSVETGLVGARGDQVWKSDNQECAWRVQVGGSYDEREGCHAIDELIGGVGERMTIVHQAGKRQANRDHEERYGAVDELRLTTSKG